MDHIQHYKVIMQHRNKVFLHNMTMSKRVNVGWLRLSAITVRSHRCHFAQSGKFIAGLIILCCFLCLKSYKCRKSDTWLRQFFLIDQHQWIVAVWRAIREDYKLKQHISNQLTNVTLRQRLTFSFFACITVSFALTI